MIGPDPVDEPTDEEQDAYDRTLPELRYCICADPEHCREPIPGYVCKAGKTAPETKR